MKAIKVLTVRQPWAGLIMLGIKNIENRTWTTQYRGKLIIQASAQMYDTDWMSARYTCRKLNIKFPDGDMMLGKTGELLGAVTLTKILPALNTGEVGADWQIEMNYGWVLENPLPFPVTIQVKGKLGLWDLPEDIHLPESVKQILSNS